MRTLLLIAVCLLFSGCSSALIDFDAGDASRDSTTDAADSMVVDSGSMDSSPPDSAMPDTAMPDSAMPDTTGVRNPAPGELVISEIMPDSHAAGDALGEWFELHNPSGTESYSLDGCSFYDLGGATERPTGVVIGPGEYMSFAISPSPGFVPDYVYESGMRLANPPDPDSLTVACGAAIIDTVAYLPYPTWPWGQGESLSLDPSNLNATDNDDVASWCPGTDPYNTVGRDTDRGSPGGSNPVCP